MVERLDRFEVPLWATSLDLRWEHWMVYEMVAIKAAGTVERWAASLVVVTAVLTVAWWVGAKELGRADLLAGELAGELAEK